MEQKVNEDMKSAVLFVSHLINDDIVARYGGFVTSCLWTITMWRG